MFTFRTTRYLIVPIEYQFQQRLFKVNSEKNSRVQFAKWLLSDPVHLEFLLNYSFRDENLATKAYWGLDLAVEMQPSCLINLLEDYLRQLKIIKTDSIIRVLNRINFHFLNCLLDDEKQIKNKITDAQELQFIEFSFETLLAKKSISGSAFAMSTLALFAFKHSWVKEELISHLKDNYSRESKGFQARARQILEQLE